MSTTLKVRNLEPGEMMTTAYLEQDERICLERTLLELVKSRAPKGTIMISVGIDAIFEISRSPDRGSSDADAGQVDASRRPRFFRRKVEAIQFVGGNDRECMSFCPKLQDPRADKPSLMLGAMLVSLGDWIVRDEHDVFSVMSTEAFRHTFKAEPAV